MPQDFRKACRHAPRFDAEPLKSERLADHLFTASCLACKNTNMFFINKEKWSYLPTQYHKKCSGTFNPKLYCYWASLLVQSQGPNNIKSVVLVNTLKSGQDVRKSICCELCYPRRLFLLLKCNVNSNCIYHYENGSGLCFQLRAILTVEMQEGVCGMRWKI